MAIGLGNIPQHVPMIITSHMQCTRLR